MGKVLIIAEKPSVAADIAKALGGLKKQADYYEGDQFLLASALGHLLEIRCPPEYEAQRGKWTLPALPVIPPRFDLEPREKAQPKLKTLEKLIKRKDVTGLVNACDAGREGELIFRYLIRHFRARLPIQRLWLQSMTSAAIRDGFAHLRSDDELRPLADAAVCRSESDWLVGINGTRAMTAFNSKGGGFNKTTVGRVQTPTLAILVEREEKIRRFVPRTYWELHATFLCGAGTYAGRWFDEQFVRPQSGKEADEALRAERLWDRERADAIRAKCLGKPGVVTEESKPTTQLSPLLFDLTSLQRDANRRFGFSATRTLALAQALYERHKVLTYPRTDSRALPEDYLGTVRNVLENLNGGPYETFAARILDAGWVRPNRRIFNNARISDHFAIIPTNVEPKHLNEAEQRIYDMVARRFLAVFYPAAEYLVTTRITRVESEPFKTEGKVLVKPGWLEVYGKEATADGDGTGAQLVPVQPGETVQTQEIEVKEAQTKPPPRFSEATLLSAMEGAGKLVDDDELRAAMAEKGLGTPATRAAIIEGLIGEDYVHRQNNELQPTPKAFMLLALLRGLGIEELTKPELTGGWEFKLKRMEHGQLSREEFMREIGEVTRHIVERTKAYQGDDVPGDFGDLHHHCPKCGGLIRENYRRFQCRNCDFSLPKFLSGRLMDAQEIETLLEQRAIGPLQGFRSRKGFPFASTLKLNGEQKLEFDFGDEPKEKESANAAPPDFTGQTPLGKCPKCGAAVYSTPSQYLCEHAATKKGPCDFHTAQTILQRVIEPAQVTKLLAEGKTDLLSGFVSKKTGRKFDAFLVLKDGAVGFEFAPRESKAKGAAGGKQTRQPPPKLEFAGQEPLGKCPKCGGQVFEGPEHYWCERSQQAAKPCLFRSGKVILQQPIDREQMRKLLAAGRTDLLSQFISRSGRPFRAYLVLDEKGKVGFEFPERETA